MARPSSISPLARLRTRLQHWAVRAAAAQPARPPWTGYVAAVAGVTAASFVIALAEFRVHISNISLVYLLVVLWLASVYGRGPA